MADLVSHPDEIKVVSNRFGKGATSLERYLELDGYKAVQKALQDVFGGIAAGIQQHLFAPITQSSLNFLTRNDPAPCFSDLLEVRFAAGSGSDPAAFTTLLDSIGGAGGYPADWTAYTEHLDFTGTGRFAFRYLGTLPEDMALVL